MENCQLQNSAPVPKTGQARDETMSMSPQDGSAQFPAPKNRGKDQGSMGNGPGMRVMTAADHPSEGPQFQKRLVGFRS